MDSVPLSPEAGPSTWSPGGAFAIKTEVWYRLLGFIDVWLPWEFGTQESSQIFGNNGANPGKFKLNSFIEV